MEILQVSDVKKTYTTRLGGNRVHVCGILGGSGRASGGKYRGTAPECRFLVAKILDRRGNGRKQDILAAIDWVCKERIRLNIRILNISVGTTEQEKSVDVQSLSLKL